MTILGWRRPGKITQRLHLSSNESCCFFFFCRDFAGDMSCASNTSCLGGSLFCSGLLADLNRAGDSFYQGGEFFAEIQRGVRRTTEVGKRVDTYGFYPLNSRFPLFPNLVQTRDRRPLRNRGTAVGLPQRLFRNIFAVHRYITATHTDCSA